jgi:acyl-CoA hydrolase/RimJ/RimL family protein N-acetyltransferase
MTSAPSGDWQEREASAEDAIGEIRPGDHVFVGSACATPRALLEALESRPKPLDGVVLVHSLTDRVGIGEPPTTNYRHRVFYVGSDVHALLATGLVEYVPISLSEVPGLVRAGRIRIDVALVQVAPPDDDGTCSLGISVDVTQAAALSARTVLAEVNEHMPRTRGDSRIPAERVDCFVPVSTPLVEYEHAPAEGVAEQIARYVARLVADGATLQIGLGRVPNRMLPHLSNRRALSIHSDVITEPVVDLISSGTVSGLVVASTAMGTQRLYDLVDDNPQFSFHPVDVVCDLDIVAGKEGLVSVTQAFSVDLTGQVCTESVGGALYGGLATGPAFHRGALASPGGLAVICLASRAPDGSPAIRAELGTGEPVTIPRSDVHWVVTEYGTTYLFGRSLAERAVALIEIAHPKDREALLEAAIERGLVPRTQLLRSRGAYPVGEERDLELRDGREIRIRPTRTTDERPMQELFFRLGEDDIRGRFFQQLQSLTDSAAQHLTSVSYDDEMAFAAVVGPFEHERIVGTGCYYVDASTGLADVAYMVDPEWQGSGLGTILHGRLVEYAREHGVRGFTADVLASNAAMLSVFKRGDHHFAASLDGGAYEVRMLFS